MFTLRKQCIDMMRMAKATYIELALSLVCTASGIKPIEYCPFECGPKPRLLQQKVAYANILKK